MSAKKLRIGELLIANKMLSAAQLEKALQAQRMYGGKLGTNLVELGLISDMDLARFLARQFQMTSADIKDFERVGENILKLVPRDIAAKHRVFPLRLEKRLVVAVSDPTDIEAIDEISRASGKPIQGVVAPEIWIIAALERHYRIPRPIRYVHLGPGEDGALPVSNVSESERMEITTIAPTSAPAAPVVRKSAKTIEETLEQFLHATTREDVLNTLLGFLATNYSRMAVFVSRRAEFQGWIVRGFPVHDREFADVRLSQLEDGLLKTVFESQKVVVRKLVSTFGDDQAFRILSLPPQQIAAALPIPFRDKCVAVVVGIPDREGSVTERQTKAAELACQRAGLALEMVVLRNQIVDLPAEYKTK